MSSLLEDAKKRTRKPKARHWSAVAASIQENARAMTICVEQTDRGEILRLLLARGEELTGELQRSLTGKGDDDGE